MWQQFKQFLTDVRKQLYEDLIKHISRLLLLVLSIIIGLAGAFKAYDWLAEKGEKVKDYTPRELRGQVYDAETNRLLPHVRVSIPGDWGDTTHTNAAGYFALDFVAHKDSLMVTVNFRAEGYAIREIRTQAIPRSEVASRHVNRYVLEPTVTQPVD